MHYALTSFITSFLVMLILMSLVLRKIALVMMMMMTVMMMMLSCASQEEFSDYEANDPWVQNLIFNLDALLTSFKVGRECFFSTDECVACDISLITAYMLVCLFLIWG